MSHDCGGPKVYKIVKHEQPGTGFWPIIAITIRRKLQFGLIKVKLEKKSPRMVTVQDEPMYI